MKKKKENIDEIKENEEMGKSKKKHRILRGILKFFLTIIILIVLFIGGFIGYSTYKNGWGWKGIVKTAVGATGKTAEELGEFQVLILGISEDISAALTDTIIVASYNPATQKATLLSIPRDTFVGDSKLRADSYDKINAIYQKSGAEGVLKKINRLTGLKIEKYLIISNNALVELVDEIGGVEFDVPINMKYTDRKQGLYINLKKGKQKLNWKQAEGLVRFRKLNNGAKGETYSYEYGNDDFGRMRTQRDFLKEVAKQTIQAKNITKIGGIIDIVKRNVTTNIKNWEEVKEYIPYAIDFDVDNLQSDTIPGDSTRIPARTGLWFFLADEVETEKKVKELFTAQNSTADISTIKEKSKIKIELLNGSGDKSLLNAAEKSLKSQGYTISKTGKNNNTVANTMLINKSKLSEEITADIKSILGTGVVSNSSTKSSVDMTIIIGKDYDG